MTLLYRYPFRFVPALAVALSLACLVGCANLPAQRRAVQASPQPLQHLTVPPPAHDALTPLLAAEFALSDGDLDGAARDYAQAAQASDDPAIAAQATRVAIAAKQWELARRGVQRWQQLHADDPGLWQARARLALHADKADDAYADLQRLLREPADKGWRAVAQTLLDAGDKPHAAALLDRLATPQALGANAETWVAVSELAAHLSNANLAQSLAQRAVTKFGNAVAYTWAAQLNYQSGDKVGARALFAAALKRDGNNTHLRIAYAALLGKLGDNAQAARVLAQGPQDDYTYAARAAYAARADDKKLMAPLYLQIKTLPGSRSGQRLNLLGELAELLGRKTEALAWYHQVPDTDEHWFEAQLRSALLLDGEGKTAHALDLIHQLQARADDDTKQLGDAFLLEADLLNKHKRGEDAMAVYGRGLHALPDDSRLLYARALLNDDLNHVDAAISDLRRLLALQPENADALNALGYTLADHSKQQAEALTLIEKALALKPDEPAIIDSLGWVQYRLGHLDEAVKQLRSAYAKQPDPEIAAHLGEVLWVSGHKNEARKIWAQGSKKDATDKVLLETMKRLES